VPGKAEFENQAKRCRISNELYKLIPYFLKTMYFQTSERSVCRFQKHDIDINELDHAA
jgi:hypothetical protein